ncbi:MAG: outer membrane lipoprotein-sorting protein [Deltaproteobacteria bacterium]|nr:outer membrane lipoprotein-sorting protein [Deltaproteobacteria bacterium]
MRDRLIVLLRSLVLLPSLVLISALVLTFSLPLPVAAHASTLEEVQACMRANLPETTSVQTIAFVTKDRIGAESETKATLYWKRFDNDLSRVMVRFTGPPDLRGAGVLMLEKKGRMPDQFMYLPELGRTRRVSTRMMSSSLFGTDFTYEDFTRIQGMTTGATERLIGEFEIEGGRTHVLESLPGPDSGSGYERIVEYIDVKMCVPLKTEMYESGKRLRKVATTPRAEVKKALDKWVPRLVHMRDEREETETRLVIEKIEPGVKINRKVFSEQNLQSRD